MASCRPQVCHVCKGDVCQEVLAKHTDQLVLLTMHSSKCLINMPAYLSLANRGGGGQGNPITRMYNAGRNVRSVIFVENAKNSIVFGKIRVDTTVLHSQETTDFILQFHFV